MNARLFPKPFEVVANALKIASGGSVLLPEGQPIALDSRKFNKAELNYIVSEQEMFGISAHCKDMAMLP